MCYVFGLLVLVFAVDVCLKFRVCVLLVWCGAFVMCCWRWCCVVHIVVVCDLLCYVCDLCLMLLICFCVCVVLLCLVCVVCVVLLFVLWCACCELLCTFCRGGLVLVWFMLFGLHCCLC